LLVQRKVTKANDTPLPLYPSILAQHLGGCGTRAFSTQTVLAAIHLPLTVKVMSAKCPLFHSDLGAKPEGAERGLKVKTHYFLSSFRA
jgi:hypothetical protein